MILHKNNQEVRVRLLPSFSRSTRNSQTAPAVVNCGIQMPMICRKKLALNLNPSSSKRKLDLQVEGDDDEADSNFHYKEKRLKKSFPACDLNNNTINSNKNEYATEDVNGADIELSEKQLWIMANHYSGLAEWERAGELLGLTRSDLCVIKLNHYHPHSHLKQNGSKTNEKNENLKGLTKNVQECFYQVLLKWRMLEPENCSLTYLTSKLGSFQITHSSVRLQNISSSYEKYVKYFQAVNNSNNQKCEHEEKGQSEDELSERDLWRASDIVRAEWKSVARHLDVSESQLVQIEHSFSRAPQDGMRECAYQTMLVWSQQSGCRRARLKHLACSLIEARLNYYAKQIIKQKILLPC